MKARGGDSARSDDISTCSAKASGQLEAGPDSPTTVGAFSRLSDGQTASSFTSNDDGLARASAQLAHGSMQDDAEELADWEIPEHQLRCAAPGSAGGQQRRHTHSLHLLVG